MPTEVHDGAQGPPRRPNGDTTTSPGAAVTGATPENLRPNVVAVLREFGIIPDHPLGKPNARPDETSLSGDVDENEPGISIAYPVIATGEQLKTRTATGKQPRQDHHHLARHARRRPHRDRRGLPASAP